MKTIRLGIIGAENSHSFKVAEMCNVLRKVPMRATHLWGETAAFAKASAEKGHIPNIVKDWKQMLGEVDGVMIDHRHGGEHAEVARYFIGKGIPTFVDKPMTCSLKEAKALFALADRKGVPVITFSAKPLAPAFQKFAARARKAGATRAYFSAGPADLVSEYGGIFFYGIHQVDCAIEVLGTDVVSVFLHRASKTDGLATMVFRDGATASLALLKEGARKFEWRAVGADQVFDLQDEIDRMFYLKSAKLIHGLIAKGEVPFSRSRMLAPIAVLEALEKSLKSGKAEKPAKF